MSLILDALRKMEMERKAKRQNSVEIRAEVLNYRGHLQKPVKSRLLPVIAALLLFSSATALFLYSKDSGTKPAETVKATAPTASGPPMQLPVPQTTQTQPAPAPAVKPATLNKTSAESIPVTTSDAIGHAPGDITIIVSGIAWQEERTLRRAVINGSLMSEGAEINGARIVEIRQNLVRLSRDGLTFDVIYTSGSGR